VALALPAAGSSPRPRRGPVLPPRRAAPHRHRDHDNRHFYRRPGVPRRCCEPGARV